jgi:hypothetical protein
MQASGGCIIDGICHLEVAFQIVEEVCPPHSGILGGSKPAPEHFSTGQKII